MTTLLDNPRFAAAYARLASVTLNPRRHTAANAHAHSEAVAARAAALARANACTPEDRALLEDLGRAHDIGKITGTARPEKSLGVLRDAGIDEARLLAYVKWHDTNLPWYLAAQRGQPPTDKAWRRLAAELDVRLLALFMIADRVDAPAGWRRNAPLSWFLDEARRRGLVGDLAVELAGQPSEISSGAALVGTAGVLAIRVRAHGFELPKGGIEWDELPTDAAVRELREEAGVTSAIVISGALGHVDYQLGEGTHARTKRVQYFRCVARGDVALDALPSGTRERRWITTGELATIPLAHESLRPILRGALA